VSYSRLTALLVQAVKEQQEEIKQLKARSITIHRIANGKLVEKWAEKDVLSFLQQIGVIPSPRHD